MIFAKKEIVSFESVTLRTGCMREAGETEIVMKDGKAEVSQYGFRYSQGEGRRGLKRRVVCSTDEILQLLNDCKLLSWNGFRGSQPIGVLDGMTFTLDATVNGGRKIHATGSQNFPKHFREFTHGLTAILYGNDTE